ncbi:pyruvate kinase 2-like [Ostrinia furnacalis]|uniref:pyruvate kinase 2-like n=1 Tax=Ostrinia furnacalis TaxID=93504 RepID=UPI0010389637|nr:pyruvate kinase 2-like [Ostrinia furnacalis]
MVWWIDIKQSDEDYHMYDKFDIQEDRIFQSVNVMFNFAEKLFDVYHIRALLKSGVNIFNIDRTIIDSSSSIMIKKAISDCNEPEMYPKPYYRPVCIAVTISVTKPVTIETDVNLIILKDVSSKQDVVDFTAANRDWKLPILVWVSKYCGELNMIELIHIAHGIVLDHSSMNNEDAHNVIQLCKKQRKSIFWLKPEIWEDTSNIKGSKRKLFVIASQIVQNGVDGIVVNGSETNIQLQTDIIRNVVEAMRLAEDNRDSKAEFGKLRKQITTPQIAPITVAIAASHTALNSRASAIIILTSTGKTARLVSWAAPPCHIVAVTTKETAAVQMHLYRKVIPVVYKGSRVGNWREECRKRVLFGTELAAKTGLFGDGAKLVVMAPSGEGVGYCDGFQMVTVPFRCDV